MWHSNEIRVWLKRKTHLQFRSRNKNYIRRNTAGHVIRFVVGIATHYKLEGPGIETRCRRDFLRLPRPALRPTQSAIQWISGRGLNHPPQPSADVKDRVELYSQLPVWASMTYSRAKFTSLHTHIICTRMYTYIQTPFLQHKHNYSRKLSVIYYVRNTRKFIVKCV